MATQLLTDIFLSSACLNRPLKSNASMAQLNALVTCSFSVRQTCHFRLPRTTLAYLNPTPAHPSSAPWALQTVSSVISLVSRSVVSSTTALWSMALILMRSTTVPVNRTMIRAMVAVEDLRSVDWRFCATAPCDQKDSESQPAVQYDLTSQSGASATTASGKIVFKMARAASPKCSLMKSSGCGRKEIEALPSF